MMKKTFLKLAVVGATLSLEGVAPVSAKIFNYSYTGEGIASAGQLIANDISEDLNGFSSYRITGITGLRNDNDIASYIRLGPGLVIDDVFGFATSFAYSTTTGDRYGLYPFDLDTERNYLYNEASAGPARPISFRLSEAASTKSTVFNFTYTGAGVSGAGQIYGDLVTGPRDYYNITSVSGLRNDEDITALINYMGSDNRLFVDRPFLSYEGIGFSTSTSSFDLYNSGPGVSDAPSYELSGRINRRITFSIREGIAPIITAVPEPATWTLMIGGFGMIGGMMRRRRPAVTAPYA